MPKLEKPQHRLRIETRHSPHFNRRPAGTRIDTIVIHNITLPPARHSLDFGHAYIDKLFMGRLISPKACAKHPYFERLIGARVSAHYFIRRSGRVIQYVPTYFRAWHAGQSELQAAQGTRNNCNDFSIGIELEGADEYPFMQAQYRSLRRLITRLKIQFPIVHIVGHSEIAPGRKTDPGPRFRWSEIEKSTK